MTLCDPMDCSPPGSLCSWGFLGKSTGVGCHFLLQGIFPAQGSNPGIAGRHFTIWATTLKANFLPAEPQGKPKYSMVYCYFAVSSKESRYSLKNVVPDSKSFSFTVHFLSLGVSRIFQQIKISGFFFFFFFWWHWHLKCPSSALIFDWYFVSM